MKKSVIIIGAGPAGLAAAYELSKKGQFVVVIEKDAQVGGLSKTINRKNFRFDLGPHRYFSKSKLVNDFWKEIIGDDFLSINRLTRIFYRDKFFCYPLKPINAFLGLGPGASIVIFLSYLKRKLFPFKNEKTLEEWVCNRFGDKLYGIFFKTYTEKFWGIRCDQIDAEWTAQRIKGLSLRLAMKNALFPFVNGPKTLIDKFMYPKYGAGMMYEKMAEKIVEFGGSILKENEVVRINQEGNRIKSVTVRNTKTSQEADIFGRDFISSMPITQFVASCSPSASEETMYHVNRLKYRSMIIVNLLLKSRPDLPDNWIYVHSPEVKMVRIENYCNWGPCMVADHSKTVLGVEYTCQENDNFWNSPDKVIFDLAIKELELIKLISRTDVLEFFVVRLPKAYPVYEGGYGKHVEYLKNYLNQFVNFQTVGRGGMFKYNNMDHSILAGLAAAENIMGKKIDLWSINSDQDYQEEHAN